MLKASNNGLVPSLKFKVISPVVFFCIIYGDFTLFVDVLVQIMLQRVKYE